MKSEEPQTESPVPTDNVEETSVVLGRYRPVKQVQEEYLKFTQMRQRGQSFVAAADISLTNPGTEVTINCVKSYGSLIHISCLGICGRHQMDRAMEINSKLYHQ